MKFCPDHLSSSLISYKHACLHLWYNVNWTFFRLLFVFSACSANMMYSVFCCSLFLACFYCSRPPERMRRVLHAGHLVWKAPVEKNHWLQQTKAIKYNLIGKKYEKKPEMTKRWEMGTSGTERNVFALGFINYGLMQ